MPQSGQAYLEDLSLVTPTPTPTPTAIAMTKNAMNPIIIQGFRRRRLGRPFCPPEGGPAEVGIGVYCSFNVSFSDDKYVWGRGDQGGDIVGFDSGAS